MKRPDWRIGVPRFHPPFYDPVAESYKRFCRLHPHIKLSATEYRGLFKTHSEEIYKRVASNPDGVLLPEQMGLLQVVLMEETVNPTMNVDLYQKRGLKVKYRNEHSGGKVGKIDWSVNFQKYREESIKMWKFIATKRFKSAVSDALKTNSSLFKVKSRPRRFR